MTIFEIIIGEFVIYNDKKLRILDKNVSFDDVLLTSPNGVNDKPIWVSLEKLRKEK